MLIAVSLLLLILTIIFPWVALFLVGTFSCLQSGYVIFYIRLKSDILLVVSMVLVEIVLIITFWFSVLTCASFLDPVVFTL